MISNIQNLPSTEQRNQAYTGGALDDFSKAMYDFRQYANTGFTALDFDFILRNYQRRTFAILEVKTGKGVLSTAQKVTFAELGRMLKTGAKSENWDFKGVFVLSFEKTSFESGKAYLNNTELSQRQFYSWLKNNF